MMSKDQKLNPAQNNGFIYPIPWQYNPMLGRSPSTMPSPFWYSNLNSFSRTPNFSSNPMLQRVNVIQPPPMVMQHPAPQVIEMIDKKTGKLVRRKSFTCGWCQFITTKKSTYDRHLRVHTGEKPFKCPSCSYAAADKRNLTTHLLTHNGKKPFKCEYCPYATTHRSHLTEHLKNHNNSKPFKCDVCSFSTSLQSNLSLHMKSHQQTQKRKEPDNDNDDPVPLKTQEKSTSVAEKSNDVSPTEPIKIIKKRRTSKATKKKRVT